jgi:ABC-type transport system substrate-binding protein
VPRNERAGQARQCGANTNWDGYCSPEVDKLIEQQSMETDEGRRKQLVWSIEKKLAEDGARPIIFYTSTRARGPAGTPTSRG